MYFKKSIILLITVLTLAILFMVGLTSYTTYRTAIKEETYRLQEIAQSNARLMEAIAEFDAVYSSDFPGGAKEATLSQIRKSHENYRGFGTTGEFTLAKKEGNTIIFLLSHRHSNLSTPIPLTIKPHLAEPMQRALQGLSGTMVGFDYRGRKVLAAYEPVKHLGLGIVAKIDMEEIRLPFLKTFVVIVFIGIILVAFAAILFYKITKPWVTTIRSAEVKYRGIFNQAAVGIARVATDGSWLEVNNKLCDIVGYSQNELLQLTFQDITYQDDLEKDIEFVKQMLDGEINTYNMEKRYIKKTGELIWINLTVSLVSDKDGHPDYFISVIEDLREKKQAVMNLSESERKLSTLMSNLPGLAYRCLNDNNWTMLFLSDACLEVTGYSADAFVNGKIIFAQLIIPEDRDNVRREIEKAIGEKRPFEIYYRLQRADDKVIWVWERGLCISEPDGPLKVLEGFISDITEQKQAELEIKQKEELFRTVFNQQFQFMAVLSKDGETLEINELSLKMQGLKAEDYIGKLFWESPAWRDFPEWKKIWPKRLEKAKNLREPILTEDIFQDASGAVRYADASTLALRTADGEVSGFLVQATDITEQKQAIKQANDTDSILSSVFQLFNDLFFLLKEDGTILDYRAKQEGDLYVPAEQFLGKKMQEVLPSEVGNLIIKNLKKSMTGNVNIFEYTLPIDDKKESYEARLIKQPHVNHYIMIVRNLSERKLAELALQNSEEKFRALFEQSGGYCMILDPNTSDGIPLIIDANKAACTMHGYSREEFIGRPVADIDDENGKRLVKQRTAEIMTGKPFYVENTHVRKDGTTFSAAINAKRIDIEGSRPLIFTTEYDITSRKQAETQLQESEKHMRTLLDTMPDLVWMKDPEGRYLSCNSRFLEFLALPEEEIVGKTDHDLFEPKLADLCCQNDKAAIASGKARINEEDAIYADGHIEQLETIKTPVYDPSGGLVGVLGIGRIITERKQIEKEWRKLAQAVEQSPESIIITNLNAEIEYVNEAFSRTTGYQAKEVIGQNPRILQSGNTPAETYKALWEKLTQGLSWQGELYNQGKDGKEYIEFAIISPIKQQDGGVSHYVAVQEDITEKKKIAHELDEYRYHLEDLVEKRTTELAKALEQADSANRAKSAFLANMSHEIRTPMNAIIGLTALLQQTHITPKQKNRLKKIDSSANHLLSIINDILDLSKIEAGKIVLEEGDFHLDALFDHIQSLFNEQTKHKGIRIEVDKNAVPIWLNGDQTRLRQALINYVGNAVKFTERGTIFLRSKKLDEKDDQVLVRFEVQDPGIGIESEKLDDLFNAFEQADSSTTRKYGGTGLGLAINKHIAQLMGGKVGAESQLNQGSTFWFTAWLKHSKNDKGTTAHTETIDHKTLLINQYAGGHVLLAEDNEINLEVASDLLSEVRLKVSTAENGIEAVKCVQNGSYDLILMDVQMPEMDGLEATKMIRAMEGKTTLPILAMTANVFEDDRRACIEAGMNDFVAKPIDLQNLYSTLVKWLPQTSAGKGKEPLNEKEEVPTNLIPDNLKNTPGINIKVGLQNSSGDVDTYLKLLKQFYSHHADDLDTLGSHLKTENGVKIRHIAHALKGSAGTLGLTGIRDAAFEIETYLRSYENQLDVQQISDLIAALKSEYEIVHNALINIKDGTISPKTVNESEQHETLLRLIQLLKINDTDANDCYRESEAIFKQVLGLKAAIVSQYIDTFNYPEALHELKAFVDTEKTASVPINLNLASKRFHGDTTKAIRMIKEKFIPQLNEIIGQLESALDIDDYKKISFLCHKLKTPSIMIGAESLANLSESLEMSCNTLDHQAISELTDNLYSEVKAIKSFVQTL